MRYKIIVFWCLIDFFFATQQHSIKYISGVHSYPSFTAMGNSLSLIILLVSSLSA